MGMAAPAMGMTDEGAPMEKMAPKAWEGEVTYEEGAPKVATKKMKAPMTAEQQAEQDEMNAQEMTEQRKPMMKVAAKAAKGKSMPRMVEEKAANSSIDISPITLAVNNLNTTINKVLTAIEARLKKNDVNSQLKKMTDFISQINDSLPVPTEGGGTRRANMKNRKKTLRNRRYRY